MPTFLLPLFLLALLATASAWAAPVRLTVLGADGKPLADAVVAVYVAGAPAQAPAGTATAELAQRNKRFAPGVLVVQAGTAVHFPNFDTVRHHVYSFSPIKVFEIKLYVGTPAAPVVFDKPGTAVLGCNIHDTMSAYVRVVDTPHFALTDAEGRAAIDLPAGTHPAQVWHPSLPMEAQPPRQPLATAGGAATLSLMPAGR